MEITAEMVREVMKKINSLCNDPDDDFRVSCHFGNLEIGEIKEKNIFVIHEDKGVAVFNMNTGRVIVRIRSLLSKGESRC